MKKRKSAKNSKKQAFPIQKPVFLPKKCSKKTYFYRFYQKFVIKIKQNFTVFFSFFRDFYHFLLLFIKIKTPKMTKRLKKSLF